VWRKKLSLELRTDYIARWIFEYLSNRNIDRLFSILQDTGAVDMLLREDGVSFDWHGGLMLKVLKLGAKNQVKRIFRFPIIKT
jgi:hypothetical protein